MTSAHYDKIYICDDYGLDASTNKAIEHLLATKSADGCSILATHITSEVKLEGKNGLHFNLTEGNPLSSPDSIASLVDRSGSFYGLKQLFIRTLLGLVKSIDIETELEAQIKHCESLCGKIYHIDGHQHIQFLPKINAVMKKRVTAKRIRCGRFVSSSFSLKYLILNFFSFLFYHNGYRSNLIIDFSQKIDIGSIENKNIEYMLHVAQIEDKSIP